MCPACEERPDALVKPAAKPGAEVGGAPLLPPALVASLRRLWFAAPPPGDPADPGCWPRIEGYEILGVLGRGGMGVVYRARQKALGREVALKLLARGQWSSAADAMRLRKEAETAARLRHEHIVPVYAVGQYQGLPYCVMELVTGGSLAQRVTELVAEPREAVRLVAAAARALHYAHLHGVCHRDVKPANVLLRVRAPNSLAAAGAKPGPLSPHPRLSDVDACVIDFGLARLTQDEAGLTRTGVMVGTPGYAAPEQVRSAKPSPAADVYGLGAVLYECLTGQPPFRAATPLDTVLLTLHKEPERPRVLNSRMPRDLETVCLKCLEKDPRRRYASASALADDLERWLGGEPLRARPVGPPGRAWRWCRRRPVVAFLTAALGLAVLLGVGGIVHQWRKAEAARHQAEASDAQTQQLLSELLQPVQGASYQVPNSQKVTHLDVLLQAESHFRDRLDKAPGDTRVRIALTQLRANLAVYYGQRGRMAQMDDSLRSARDLWEPLARQDPRNPVYRDWLANTYLCEADAATRKGQKARSLQLTLRAVALWQELADERPSDPVVMKNVAVGHSLLFIYGDSLKDGEDYLRVLEEEESALRRQPAGDGPSGTAARKSLALTHFIQGEVHVGMRAPDKAIPCYRQAYEQYKTLPEVRADDPTTRLTLALCCSQLMEGRSSSPYYFQAVSLFEEACERLEELARTNPGNEELRRALVEGYGYLAVCHWKARRPDEARQTFRQRVRPLLTLAGAPAGDCRLGLSPLTYLSRMMDCLEKDKNPACLEVAREAAALIDRFADAPFRDGTQAEEIARQSLAVAAVLCRLGCPAESLRQAEQGRRLYEALRHAAPDVLDHSIWLSEAWVRVAKVRWALDQRDEALTALRESTAVLRQVFDRSPSAPFYRQQLSRRYEQLAYFSGLRGDRAAVAAALLEREKLWPDSAEELAQLSQAFRRLADAVGEGREQLSDDEQGERRRYVTECERIARIAERQRRE